jgi:ribosomal protein L12E/L44/L45/RPP1/RPP2
MNGETKTGLKVQTASQAEVRQAECPPAHKIEEEEKEEEEEEEEEEVLNVAYNAGFS